MQWHVCCNYFRDYSAVSFCPCSGCRSITLRLRKGPANGVTRRRFAYDLEVTKNKKHILVAYVCFDIFALLLGIYVLLIVKPGWALIIVALFFVYYVYSVYKGQIALIKEVLSSNKAARQTSENM